MSRSPELLHRVESRLLLVDLQEKLLPVMQQSDAIVENCRRLAVGAGLFGVPVSVTEQYPQGLGATVPALAEFAIGAIPKREFSCVPVLPWCQGFDEPTEPTPSNASPTHDARRQIVIAGIEAHVCVQQTVFDLLSVGFSVYVVADGISSRQTLMGRTHQADAMPGRSSTTHLRGRPFGVVRNLGPTWPSSR
ncbi:MAG: isochorismatase family protein [Planctomycetaceae bacterium]